jgi:hypothetical protein
MNISKAVTLFVIVLELIKNDKRPSFYSIFINK